MHSYIESFSYLLQKKYENNDARTEKVCGRHFRTEKVCGRHFRTDIFCAEVISARIFSVRKSFPHGFFHEEMDFSTVNSTLLHFSFPLKSGKN